MTDASFGGQDDNGVDKPTAYQLFYYRLEEASKIFDTSGIKDLVQTMQQGAAAEVRLLAFAPLSRPALSILYPGLLLADTTSAA